MRTYVSTVQNIFGAKFNKVFGDVGLAGAVWRTLFRIHIYLMFLGAKMCRALSGSVAFFVARRYSLMFFELTLVRFSLKEYRLPCNG